MGRNRDNEQYDEDEEYKPCLELPNVRGRIQEPNAEKIKKALESGLEEQP